MQSRYLIHRGFFRSMRTRYFRKVLSRCGLPAGSRFLDYGCGAGDMLEVCRESGIDAFGVDASPRSVGLAASRGFEVSAADFESLPYEPAYFDAIFLQSVIEHAQQPVAMLTRLKQYAKKGGLLIVSAPTPESDFWDDPTHLRPYTPKSFEVLAEICELEIVEINYVFSFLLGFRLRSSLIYKLLNLLPFPVGTNLIGIFRVS